MELPKGLKRKCKHGRSKKFCCLCRYGDINSDTKGNYIRDGINGLSVDIGYKLIKGSKMMREDEVQE